MVIYKKKVKVHCLHSLLLIGILRYSVFGRALFASFFFKWSLFSNMISEKREKKKIVNAENKFHCYGEKTFVLKKFLYVGGCMLAGIL